MKLSLKKILTDPSAWLLLAANIVAVYYYASHPTIFTTLIWLYWSQSVMYGIFAFTDMKLARKADSKGYTGIVAKLMTKDQYASASVWLYSRIFFFMHAVYVVFIISMPMSGPFDWAFFWKLFATFFFSQLVNFLQHSAQRRRGVAEADGRVGKVFVRVVPMHLCILAQAFFHAGNLPVLLILKVITDVAGYIHTTSYYRKEDIVSSATAINIENNLNDLM